MNLVAAACCPALSSVPRQPNVHLYSVALRNDSRFLKQAQSVLKAGMADEVVLIGRAAPGQPAEEVLQDGIRFVRFRTRLARLPKFKPFGCLKFLEFISCQARLARRLRPASIQCHSVSSLPAGVLAARTLRVPLIYDARELETESNGLQGFNQAFTRLLERALIGHCNGVLCVSDSIADWYARAYSIRRPFVVRNIPDTENQSAESAARNWRRQLGIPDEALILMYSGALIPGRRIDQLMRVFRRLGSGYHLVFMGFGQMESLIKTTAETQKNVHFVPAVPPTEVLGALSGADAGVVGVENRCLSYHLSLPNKLFEYLLAGIPFIAPDYPEMRRVIEEHGCGWVVGEQDDDWLAVISRLKPGEVQAKRDRAVGAQRTFSWENESRQLIQAYQKAGAVPCQT